MLEEEMLNREKKGTLRRAGRTATLVGALGLLAAGLTACSDSGVDPEQTIETAGEASDVLSSMTAEAGLSSSDVPGLPAITREYEGRLGEPGMTWYLAADLQAVMTSDQIAAIAAFQQELGQRVRNRGRERFGEGPSDGPGRRFGHAVRSGDGIDLTEDQRAAVEALAEKYRPECEAIREAIAAGTLDREEAHAKMEAVREAFHAEFETILTDEQKAKLEEHRAEMEEHRAEMEEHRAERQAKREARRGDHEAAREAGRDAMQDALGLTEEQIAAIDALRGEWSADADESREERRAAHEAAMEEILTDTQLEIVALHRALDSRLRIRRMGAGGQDEDGFGRRGGFGQRDGSGRRGPGGSGSGAG
jgi:Spy/CpxP family protein refolding chaperone